MNRPEIIASIIAAVCSLFSAVTIGIVAWSWDRVFRDIDERFKSNEKRIGRLETRAMTS